MDKEVVQKLIADGSHALSQFASAAKTTGEHLYGVLVRQQMIEGICGLIGISVWIVVNVIFLKRFFPFVQEKIEKDKYSDWDIAGVFLIIIFALLSGLAMGITMFNLQRILNPEFFAIKFILDGIKQ